MKVVFVNMPFAGLRAAIGPSLLKAHLAERGHEATVLYLNLRFAEELGSFDYDFIADRAPTQSLAGDWVFSSCLYGPRPASDAAYLESLTARFGRYDPAGTLRATIARARAETEPFLERCLDDPVWEQYDVIGFTSTFTQHVASLALARRLKERFPDKTLLFGGANCEGAMGVALKRLFPFVDYVCSGEADLSLPALIDALAEGRDPSTIPGVISEANGGRGAAPSPERVRHLDDLPVPDFSDYFGTVPSEMSARRGVLMETSRGCWWGEKHHCTFCGLNGTSMTFRSKSATRVLDELDTQVERYRPTFIEMVDNILDMHYFQDLLPALRARELRLGLFYETKANLTKEQVFTLRASGVEGIQPGIESFSSDVLKLMRKGTTTLQNIQLLRWCQEAGMKVFWNLLYGFPGEDPEDYRTMAGIVDQLTHLQTPQGVGRIRLDRFSPNFESAGELGLCNVRPDQSYLHIYDESEADLAQLAYYFEHDYLDRREPGDYAAELEAAVWRWFGPAGRGAHVYLDRGDDLAVWDFRPVAKRRLTVLTGLDREVYLLCDRQRSGRAVEELVEGLGSTAEHARDILSRLTTDGLVLEADDRYLILAVATSAIDDTVDQAPAGSLVAF